MKRIVSLTIALLLLTGCAAKAPAEVSQTDAKALVSAVLDSQGEGEKYTFLEGEELDFYLTEVLGLGAGSWTDAASAAVGGVDPREVTVICTGDGEAVLAALEDYRTRRQGDFTGYAPEAAALVENGMVVGEDGKAALLICDDPSAAAEALGGGASLPAISVQTTEGPGDRGDLIPFHPPGDHDMTPYDNSAILAAWAAGDPNGLDETQRAIYDACRDIFDEVIREGMSDYEKELALHDWLVRHGDYDRTALGRSGTFQDHADDPYGLLVGGYGICLGYASSFQLLMDLAGVECITVPGAAFSSGEDHTWNMVKLDGEWYCVDVTWDDPVSASRPKVWEKRPVSHTYFNVTSQFMADTDHQWDYDSIPWTSAEKYRYG